MDKKIQKTLEQIAKEAREAVRKSLVERFGDDFVKWEKEYAPRNLNYIEVEDKIAILRPIGAQEIATYSMALVNPEEGMVTATRFLLEELWLDGDNEIRDNEEYFIGAMLQVQNVVQTKNSRFIKL